MAQGFQVFAHGSPLTGGADYTERVGTERAGLNRPEALKTGWDVFPAKGSVVERRFDVPMDLEHERELMRQGNDRRATGLTSKALFPAGVQGAATNAAVLRRCLLDGGLTSWTGADLERSGLLQTVSDQRKFPSIFRWPLPRPPFLRSLPSPVSPDALLIMLARSCVSSVGRAYPHRDGGQRNSWG